MSAAGELLATKLAVARSQRASIFCPIRRFKTHDFIDSLYLCKGDRLCDMESSRHSPSAVRGEPRKFAGISAGVTALCITAERED
jgi:hypothetical protein